MSLINVRKEINIIDDSMKKLFDDRLKCSYEVAQVKIKENDDVYKPEREAEICERFSGEEDYILFIKKVMQISRKFQYKTFIAEDKLQEDFIKYADENYRDVFEKGGTLKIELQGDDKVQRGLSVCDILSVIADTKLQINNLSVDGEKNKVTALFLVENDTESKKEAMLLTYMLFKETI